MSLSQYVQWDVRTGGSDSNGGGFDPSVASPGTDYSQQNTAQVAFTDLVIGATTTQLTSSANPFNSASVGNILNITAGSGFTTGRYTVVSVSGTTATMDRPVGTASSTGGTGNLGGSLATVATALSLLTVNFMTVNLQAGTYTQTSTLASPNNIPFTLIGYQTTHGDMGTRPLITTATNSTDLFNIGNNSGSGWVSVVNVNFSNTAGTSANGCVKTVNNGAVSFTCCKFSGFTTALNGDNAGAHFIYTPVTIDNCEISTCSSTGIGNESNVHVSNSYIHGCTTYGIAMLGSNNSTVTLSHSVLDSNGIGVHLGVSLLCSIDSCVFSNSTTDGVTVLNTYTAVGVRNSIFYSNGGYAVNQINTGNSAPAFYGSNAYGSNGSAGWHNFALFNTGADVTLSASPFAGSGNFALNSAAGGGALLKGAGFPGVMPAGTGGADIGALQSLAAVSPVYVINQVTNRWVEEP